MTSSAKLQTCREGLSNQCLPVSTCTQSQEVMDAIFPMNDSPVFLGSNDENR